MLRILLLDCSDSLELRLKTQGFDIEVGTVGFATGVRHLPSQVYEQNVFFYNPTQVQQSGGRAISEREINNSSPGHDLRYLEGQIERGDRAEFLVQEK